MGLTLQESIVVTLMTLWLHAVIHSLKSTLDQIQDLRHLKEKQLGETASKSFIVPAPVIIAEAIEALHFQYFP